MQKLSRFIRRTILALAIATIPSLPARAADPVLKPNDTIAICGDSITEAKGYSAYIEDYILMCKPVENIRTVQGGWGGSTAQHFVSTQFQTDVLRYQPTVATICFGMNDGGYRALAPELAERHKTNTQTAIDNFKKNNVRTILLSSAGVVDSDSYGKGDREAPPIYNKTLGELRDIDKDLATKNNLIFVDMHSIMMDAMTKSKAKYGPKYQFAGGDGVHPAANGHLVMAYAFLKAFAFDGNIGTITLDLKTNGVTATEGHKLLADTLKDGAIEIESTRYPFCFSGEPDKPNATTGIIEFIPFNQELNRLTLIIKNPPANGAKVTWGTTSKTFTADQLTTGINLAAEFLDNPFVAQFQKVHTAVVAQQAFENTFLRGYMTSLPNLKDLAADEDKPALDRILATGIKKAKTLQDTAAALVTPVRHTLKIEPAK